jgi:hypothetical protein
MWVLDYGYQQGIFYGNSLYPEDNAGISKDIHPSGEPDHPQLLRFSAFAV